MTDTQAHSAESLKAAEDLVESLDQIATLPEVATRVIDLAEDPKVGPKDIEEVISADPALCARLLKVVNSAAYGMSYKVDSVQQAIALLGINMVRNLVIAGSMVRLFRDGRITVDLDAKGVWTHSLGVSAAARIIGEQVAPQDAPVLFLAGLLHDVGLMVEIQTRRAALKDAVQVMADKGLRFMDAERAVLRTDHAAVGLILCQRWCLPNVFCVAAGYHHAPEAAPEKDRRVARIIYLADVLVAKLAIGFAQTAEGQEPDAAVLDGLGVGADDLAKFEEQIPAACEAAAALFEID